MLRKHISTVRFSSYLHPKNTFHTKKESIKSITFIRKIGSNFLPNSRLFSSQPDSLSLSAKIKAEVMKFHLPILIACMRSSSCFERIEIVVLVFRWRWSWMCFSRPWHIFIKFRLWRNIFRAY